MKPFVLLLFLGLWSSSLLAQVKPKKGMKAIFAEQICKDLDGKEQSLSDILQEQQGKVVFLDIWASWCGPCKEEMKASKALQSKLNSSEVVFIYLSIDESDLAWKKAVQKLNLKPLGLHYRRGQKAATELMQFLRARTIPRYVIFDRKGIPVELDAAFPSEEECLEQLQSALKNP
jgi:thiol-disulfide isomerase/thioredoxin